MATIGDVFGVLDKGLDGFLAYKQSALANDRIEAEIALLNRQTLALPSLSANPGTLTIDPLPALPAPAAPAPVSPTVDDPALLSALFENDQAIASQLSALSRSRTTQPSPAPTGAGLSTETMIAIGLVVLVIAAGARR